MKILLIHQYKVYFVRMKKQYISIELNRGGIHRVIVSQEFYLQNPLKYFDRENNSALNKPNINESYTLY